MLITSPELPGYIGKVLFINPSHPMGRMYVADWKKGNDYSINTNVFQRAVKAIVAVG